MNATTSTNSATITFADEKPSGRKLWGAYGVVDEDGALSWKTYPDVESAKSDQLYGGRARIIRLRMEDVGTEHQREPSRAEVFAASLSPAVGPSLNDHQHFTQSGGE